MALSYALYDHVTLSAELLKRASTSDNTDRTLVTTQLGVGVLDYKDHRQYQEKPQPFTGCGFSCISDHIRRAISGPELRPGAGTAEPQLSHLCRIMDIMSN